MYFNWSFLWFFICLLGWVTLVILDVLLLFFGSESDEPTGTSKKSRSSAVRRVTAYFIQLALLVVGLVVYLALLLAVWLLGWTPPFNILWLGFHAGAMAVLLVMLLLMLLWLFDKLPFAIAYGWDSDEQEHQRRFEADLVHRIFVESETKRLLDLAQEEEEDAAI